MNKIMELDDAMGQQMKQHPYPPNEYEPACNCAACAVAERDKIQAEVTRMEAELADYKQRYLDCTAQTARAEDRAEAAEAKLAALEAQEPIAFGWPDSKGSIIDCISPKSHSKHPGDYTIPPYLAAGAKQESGIAAIADAWADVEKHFAPEPKL